MLIFHLEPNTEKTYRFVGSITATLHNFFIKSQNFDDNEEYLALNVRSTSVGDIIFIDDIFYILTGISIEEVNFLFNVENLTII